MIINPNKQKIKIGLLLKCRLLPPPLCSLEVENLSNTSIKNMATINNII